MTARMIDGAAIAKEIRAEIAIKVAKIKEKFDPPHLGVLLVGNDPASEIYVRKKKEACEEVGIRSTVFRLFPDGNIPEDGQKIVEQTISFMNTGCFFPSATNQYTIDPPGIRPECDGILLQLPLPVGLSDLSACNRIRPTKDVDVLCAENVGYLVQGHPRYKPCTPHGIQQMLRRSNIEIAGKHVVVINRSNVVGKPLSSMLIQDCDDYANATVTVCHNKTPEELLKEITKAADIIIVAVGIPGFLKQDMVSPESVVVDVGTNRIGNKIVGDVAPEVWNVAGAVTRNPGGVGPMTIAMLLDNTLKSGVYRDEFYNSQRGQ